MPMHKKVQKKSGEKRAQPERRPEEPALERALRNLELKGKVTVEALAGFDNHGISMEAVLRRIAEGIATAKFEALREDIASGKVGADQALSSVEEARARLIDGKVGVDEAITAIRAVATAAAAPPAGDAKKGEAWDKGKPETWDDPKKEGETWDA